MTDHPSVPPGSLLGGKFRIERLLGAGAMGTVYAIDHELTRHKRALKLLHPAVQSIPDIVRRFLNEASAAGRAGNPHLVETFDAGTLPTGEPYVVMELLEGETLGTVLHRERTLDPSRAAELVAQAAEGIEAAHRAGIVHRDLKPENLFVTKRDGAPFIKIMDFGVSKFSTASAGGVHTTRAGMVYGSPAYMSPEQLTGQVGVDGRTDVFALGVVLFECLTGSLPFDAPTIEVLMVRILGGKHTPIESLRAGLPSGLAEIVRHALNPNRDDRIPTARALAEALAPFRALSLRETPNFVATDLAFASTLASEPPVFTIRPSSAPSTLPPGVPRPGRTLVPLLAIATIGIATGAALLVARPRPPAVTAASAPLALPTPSATPSAVPATATLAATAAPGASIPAPPIAARSASPEDPRRASASPAPNAASVRAAPSSAAPSRSSTAQDLGLREDNPFR